MQPVSPTLQIPDVSLRPAWADRGSLAQARADLYAQRPIRDQKLVEAVVALENADTARARRIASRFLAKHPRSADALNIMGEIAARAHNVRDAERFLRQCIQCAPDHEIYRYNYVVALMESDKLQRALAECEILVAKNPKNPLFRSVKAHLLGRTRKYAEAADLFRELTVECPDSAEVWMGLANALRTLGGHADEVVLCLRTVAGSDPACGSAWWALASTKTVRFTHDDVRIMEEQLSKSDIAAVERSNLYYALGKACEDIKQYEKSFQYYSKGNAIRRVDLNYDPDSTTRMVSRARAVFTPELFRECEHAGCPSPEPIFVVGLQRSGSTLTEQILGSHSQIEGAGELQTLIQIVGADVMPKTGPDYPNGMDRLTPDDLRSLGEKYLEQARLRLSQNKPFFVDKNCYNIWQAGLIHLMLPNARIIDVRRHPLAACWANFTVSFTHAPPLSYKLTDIGRFYHDYVRLMAHLDRVIPGKIHRVIYENLVADLESEVRRMLEFVGLPFEPGCLEYYRSDRAFNSFSNEQVRRPIFKEGVDRWRAYDPWLGPLKAALGPVLDAYPGVPEFPV